MTKAQQFVRNLHVEAMQHYRNDGGYSYSDEQFRAAKDAVGGEKTWLDSGDALEFDDGSVIRRVYSKKTHDVDWRVESVRAQ